MSNDHRQLDAELLEAMTRLSQSEQLVRHKNEELEARNRDLREYSAAVTHELRAPLAAVKGFSEMLLDLCAGRLDERGQHLLERIHFNVLQMDRIIRGLQELLLSGQESEPRALVDPARVFRNVIDNRRVEAQGVGLKIHLAPDLPTVFVHPTKLYQLFDNLLSNALKHAVSGQAGGLSVSVAFEPRPEGGGIFAVEDDGPGVPAAHRTRVFELFFRLDRRQPGVGLGLSMCRRIVELYRGRIWVETGGAGGARFCFTLPAGFEAP